MADDPRRRRMTPEQEAAANAAADRIAERYRNGDPSRLFAYIERQAEAEDEEGNENIMGEIIDRIREAIENCGFSRYELAKRSGVSEALLSRFMSGERDNMTIETLEKLAEVLGLELVQKKRTRKRKTE